MALGAVLLASNAELTTHLTSRDASLQAAANGGLGIIRDSINHGVFDSLLPDSGYTTLASNAPVLNALGQPLPGVQRWLYVAGPAGGPVARPPPASTGATSPARSRWCPISAATAPRGAC